MRGFRYAIVVPIGMMLALASCKQDKVAEQYHPAQVDSTDVKGIMRVTLQARAAERIGLQTAPITEEKVFLKGQEVVRRVIPYGALMYDTKGDAWTFTNPEPLVFIRKQVAVEDIDGNRVVLADGPPAGTAVVTVGAAELMGAEHKYGH